MQLYLENNKLTSLSKELMSEWNSLQIIDIRYNNWNCNCSNQWMYDKLLPMIRAKHIKLSNNIQ